MGRVSLSVLALALALAAPVAAAAPAAPVAATPASQAALNALFADWRRFVSPEIKAGVADYSAAAMARKAAALPGFRQRLAAIDTRTSPVSAQIDHRMIESEMNGLDFSLRVLKPWARDPSFDASVFGEMSDVPAHEGPSAEPNIDLYAFKYPLSRADDARLATLIGAIPANLAAAKVNLAGSDAHDLWAYGNRAFDEQAAVLAALGKGTLVMRTLEGKIPADAKGFSPALRRAIAEAGAATEDFARWLKAEAPGRKGPTGVGKANYDWYMKNVSLVPYTWDEQVVLLRRELDRSIASLRLEEARNAKLPPMTSIEDAAAFRRMAEAKSGMFSSFLAEKGFVPDLPEYRAAIFAQTSPYEAPANRNFFGHVTALDPLPLLSHSTHWIDLARLKYHPHASPIRQVPPLFNIYADRSEGFATAMEELVMQAGLYDDIPHGRELVWIMLANRAARGLASLHVQSNEIGLAEAGKFHAGWTPRGYSDANSPLVGFEQLLYARQPGYGPSYVTGKLQLDRLIADASHAAEMAGRPFVLKDFMTAVYASAIVPPPLIGAEMLGALLP